MGLIARAVMVLVAGIALAGCDCPQIKQQVFIAPPDPTLQPLIDACRSGVPPAGQTCSPLTPIGSSTSDPPVPCACRPLCLRVLELIDQFSGRETLLECRVKLPAVSGMGGAGGGGGGAGGAGGGGGGAGGQGGTAGAGGMGGVSFPPLPPPRTVNTIEVDVTYRPSTCG